jgi:hypothetical protein
MVLGPAEAPLALIRGRTVSACWCTANAANMQAFVRR